METDIKFHTPVPDGRTGPWMRKPHAKSGDVREGTRRLKYDPRCGRCVYLRELDEVAFDKAYGPEGRP